MVLIAIKKIKSSYGEKLSKNFNNLIKKIEIVHLKALQTPFINIFDQIATQEYKAHRPIVIGLFKG